MGGPQGHFRRNTGIYTEAYDETCKSAPLRGNLCISVRQEDRRQTTLIRTEKYSLHVENM